MIYTVSSSNFDGNGEIKEQSMNLKEAGRIGEDAFLKAGITDGLTDARLLLEWVTGISLAEYAMNPFQPMTTEQERRYLELVEKRRRRAPLQHLTGEQEFMGLIFRVSPDVLIPRQDTELLTEEALKRLRPGMNVLDLCTGSGCIIVSLEQIGKKRRAVDERNTFTGSDISHAALQIAEINKLRYRAEVSFVESDLFERLNGSYDMIVSNPPYIKTDVIAELEEEVRCYDPIVALDGREDGLYFYRRIVQEAKSFLNDGGQLLLEIGYDQKRAVTDLMEGQGFREIRVLKDLAGLDRVVTGRYDKC